MSDWHASHVSGAEQDERNERYDALRRPAMTIDRDIPCRKCGIRRSIHVRPDGFGGENAYLKIRRDDERAFAHMRGGMCLYRI